MHYIANTLYHACEKDCHGLLKGEKQQILKGGKVPVWIKAVLNADGEYVETGSGSNTIDSYTKPENDGDFHYIPWCRTGEGSEANLEYARSSACAPDATLEQLQSKEWLEARLPTLLDDFKKVIEGLGFTY